MNDFQKPSAMLTLTEGLRSLWDFSALSGSWPTLPRGLAARRRTVLVVPGFGLGDASTLLLRGYLTSLGHSVHGWGQGTNLGLHAATAHRLAARLSDLAADEGVVLIAHSVGALYARYCAWLRPESVSELITLAGPHGDGDGKGSRAIGLYHALNPEQRQRDSEAGELFQTAMTLMPAAPVTCLYTRADGVLDWRSTVQSGHCQAQNIEVPCSHLGMLVHPLVWRLLALRLAEPEPWRPLVLDRTQVRALLPQGS